MEMPIESLIQGKRLEVARMQDRVITLIYDHVQPDAMLYGGTAIWRCYGGGRFSEDIDIYVDSNFWDRLAPALKKEEITVTWRDAESPLHMRLSDGNTELLLEASTGRYESSISQYARTDGSTITITTLSPTELLVRKTEAYLGRRYVRDIYDIVHLTNYLRKDDPYVLSTLRAFLKGIEKPVDERILQSLVYKGEKRMTFEKMVDYLERWADEV